MVMNADLEEMAMNVFYVLQGLVVMSADLEEMAMNVLFMCCIVWW